LVNQEKQKLVESHLDIKKVETVFDFAYKIVFFMSICDLVGNIANLFNTNDENNIDGSKTSSLCWAQSILDQFGEIGSVLWNAAIAHSIQYVLSHHCTARDTRHLIKKYHKFIWPTLILLTLLPLINNSYGWSDGWCWIQNKTTLQQMFRMICDYVPIWMTIMYIAYVYWYALKNWKPNDYLRRLRWFPLIILICFTPASINRVYQLISPKPVFILTICQALGVRIVGLINAIVYGWTTPVKITYRILFTHIFTNSQLHDPSVYNAMNNEEDGTDGKKKKKRKNKNKNENDNENNNKDDEDDSSDDDDDENDESSRDNTSARMTKLSQITDMTDNYEINNITINVNRQEQ